MSLSRIRPKQYLCRRTGIPLWAVCVPNLCVVGAREIAAIVDIASVSGSIVNRGLTQRPQRLEDGRHPCGSA
jgi:hypothetical protein